MSHSNKLYSAATPHRRRISHEQLLKKPLSYQLEFFIKKIRWARSPKEESQARRGLRSILPEEYSLQGFLLTAPNGNSIDILDGKPAPLEEFINSIKADEALAAPKSRLSFDSALKRINTFPSRMGR